MSSHSYTNPCPNCDKEANVCSENRPYEQVDITCIHCGFFTYTDAGYMDLEEINQMRLDKGENLKPLTELPERRFVI